MATLPLDTWKQRVLIDGERSHRIRSSGDSWISAGRRGLHGAFAIQSCGQDWLHGRAEALVYARKFGSPSAGGVLASVSNGSTINLSGLRAVSFIDPTTER
ncbi:MAG TPA: hypothetical protein VLK84_02370 [Longimicrobium sp.]|nr:hypothetical protein [Longimicrobium sp.]